MTPSMPSQRALGKALHEACRRPNNAGLGEACRLLSAGANVDFTDPAEPRTPLMLAAVRGNLLVCDLLIKRGADVNKRLAMPDAGTALNGAVVLGHLEVGCVGQWACSWQ
jgi:ankyrin repeat protein